MTTIKELEDQIDTLTAALAVAGGAAPATVEAVTDDTAPAVGTVLHVLKPLAIGGEIRNRGAVFEVTEQLRAGTVDRNGVSSLNGLIERGILALEWPKNENRWLEPGDQQWTFERGQALEAARRIISPGEQTAAINAVHRRFGPAPEGWREPMKQTRSKWSV